MTAADVIAALEAKLAATEARLAASEVRVIEAEAKASSADALIARLTLAIEKLRRELYGQRSERKLRLLEQMELELEELEASATEDEIAAAAAARTTNVEGFTRRKPVRKPFPAHLPRERVVVPTPTSCSCCGSDKLTRLGEDVTETLEVVPRSWKVVQTVRERVSCRMCERVYQAPAPFHVIPRAHVGPSLLAMVLFEKFGQHQPLNRQSERYRREGIELSVSTLADHVGAATAALRPLYQLIERHVLAAERLHGDDTTVPVAAKGKTTTGRIWTYVRDDRPFGGNDPPAAIYYYSSDRSATHPEQHLARYGGILQADAYAGYNALYDGGRTPAPITEAGCWAHARRKFYVLADIASKARGKKPIVISPIAAEAVKRIDQIFDEERAINGASADERRRVRAERVAPLVADLEAWMREHRPRLSRHDDVAKACDYMLKRWDAFAAFLADGRICLTNNAAERALRGIALGRKSWLFAGSDRGGQRAAAMYALITTAKLNDVDPQAWLADVLARIADLPMSRLDELLPWNWKPAELAKAA